MARRWNTWQSARSWRSPDGTVRPANRAAGNYAGAGVARGGQQGRMSMMHGGLGGTKRGGATAGSSYARQLGPANTRPQAPSPSTGPVANPTAHAGNDHGPAIKPGSPYSPTVKPGGSVASGSTHYGTPINTLADGTRVVGGWEDPARAMAPYLDSQYWMDRAAAQSQYAEQVNPLVAEINSLQRDEGQGTLHDVLLGRLQQNYELDERRRRGIASQQGNLRSGLSDLRRTEMANQFVDGRLDLFNQYGGGRVQQLEAQRAAAQAALQQQLSMLALALADRVRQRGANIGTISFNPNVIPGFGG